VRLIEKKEATNKFVESHWRLAPSSDKVSPGGRCAR